jgi:HK97 family phage prohead protease
MTLLKDFRVQVKAGPDDGLEEGEFTAYASVFGNKDSYGDVVIPGAFTDTLAEWKDSGNVLPLLFGHNMSDPDYNIGGVKEAVEDDHGLLTRSLLDLDNPKALQTYRLVKGRRLSQMSFAYDVLEGGEAQREKSNGDGTEYVYELRKLKLYEVSVVPIGANQETSILAVKAAQSALRLSKDNLSEDTLTQLLKAYHALGDLLNGGQETNTSHTGPSKGEAAASGNPSKANPAARLKLLAAMQTQLELNGVMP